MERTVHLEEHVDTFFFEHLLDLSLRLVVLLEMLRTAQTTPKWECAFCSLASSRMRYVQRTVFSEAVLYFPTNKVAVAILAVPSGPATVEECDGATLYALPIDIVGSVASLADV